LSTAGRVKKGAHPLFPEKKQPVAEKFGLHRNQNPVKKRKARMQR